MLSSYLKIAFRNMLRHKLHSIINVLGLSVGIAACVLIALFVRDEVSFDSFWKDADQIYRLHTAFHSPGREPSVSVQAPGPARAALLKYFENDISHAARFTPMSAVVTYKGEPRRQTIHLTDSDAAELFPLQVMAGDLAVALDDKSSIAVSQSFAERYFGKIDAIGQTITLSVRKITRDLHVAAVFKDLPHNSVLDFEFLTQINEADFVGRFDGWTSVSGSLFFKLRPDRNIQNINEEIGRFTDTQVNLGANTIAGVTPSEQLKFSTMPLKDLHLKASGWGEMKAPGDQMTVAIMAIIAGLILFLATTNFTNLLVAQSTTRAREVALRKVAGAKRSQLVYQFLGEYVFVALIASLIGLAMVDVLLPLYSEFLARDLAVYYDGWLMGAAALLAVSVGVLGGIYPAITLSGYLPNKILKASKSKETKGTTRLRYVLVVLQFTVSTALIVATIVVFGQLGLVKETDRGFETENLMVLDGARSAGVREIQSALKREIEALPEVREATYSWRVPGRGGGTTTVEVLGDGASFDVGVNVVGRGYGFLSTYDIKLLAGRDYDRAFERDGLPSTSGAVAGDVLEGTVVINERAATSFGFRSPDEAIGKTVRLVLSSTAKGPIHADMEIIGVAANAHFYSLRDQVQPEMHELVKAGAPYLSVRYEGQTTLVMDDVQRIWRELAPSAPLTISRASDIVAADFAQEDSFGTVMSIFTVLAILIACLGLYGLASFSSERRTKEIGIRKVLGAGVLDIIRLLIWQFTKPILVANLIAWPLVTWVMLRWLESFAYRLEAWVLVPLCLASGLVALSIAWVTVGGNAAKVARTNPIKALRYE